MDGEFGGVAGRPVISWGGGRWNLDGGGGCRDRGVGGRDWEGGDVECVERSSEKECRDAHLDWISEVDESDCSEDWSEDCVWDEGLRVG